MAQRKRFKLKSKWYRPATLAYTAAPETLDRQAGAYLDWLATDRGWLREGRKCEHCHGTGESRWFGGGRRKSAKCNYCYGSGVIGSAMVPDRDAARSYCNMQRAQLEQIAEHAVDGLRHRLFWHGFRPFISYHYGRREAPANLAEYEERETERDAIDAQLQAAYDESARLRGEYETLAATLTGEAWEQLINGPERPAYHAADREAERLCAELHSYGYRGGESRWYLPGEPGSIHVGISGARRGYDTTPPTASIIVKPGLAPSGEELDAMIAEALAAMQPEQILLAA